MELLQKFKNHWQHTFCHLPTSNCQLLLAVSGGIDSIVLVDLIAKSGFAFTIAHCNFQLRGEESERDEQFVRSLGQKYSVEVLVKKMDTQQYATDKKCSIQEAARELRYAWFSEVVGSWYTTDDGKKATVDGDEMIEDRKKEIAAIRHQTSHNYIVTAHHADDNIETMLMRFFRGTGMKGLLGIQPILKERSLLRPLLAFRKAALLEYAAANKLSFVEDSSNASDKYTRNFFRNRLMPQIKEVYPQVEDNLLHNIERFNEVMELYRQSVDLQLSKLVEKKGTEWHIPVLKWKKIIPIQTITWELISPFGFTALQTLEVIKLLEATNGSFIASPTHRIIRNRNWIIISPNSTSISKHILIETGDTNILFENGVLRILQTQHSTFIPPLAGQNNLSEAFLNMDKITFPLLLRKWKTGDYFYPLGMQKKKKINRFLIDQKLSKTEKEKLWVLESNQKIIWVIGIRIDDRFKITDQTKKIVSITYLK